MHQPRPRVQPHAGEEQGSRGAIHGDVLEIGAKSRLVSESLAFTGFIGPDVVIVAKRLNE